RETCIRNRPETIERSTEQTDSLPASVQPDHRVAVAEALGLGQRRQRRSRCRRKPKVDRTTRRPTRHLRERLSLGSTSHLAELPEELATRSTERVEPTHPDQALDDLLHQPGSLDDVGQVLVRSARQLGIEPLGLLVTDPLDETESQSHAVAHRAL